MDFFSNLINTIRGINKAAEQNVQINQCIFGVIMSGEYSQWKTDQHPTFFCMGTYISPKNGKRYVHGIQLHHLSENLLWFLNIIKQYKGYALNPLIFFNFIKMNNYNVIKNGYRTYLLEYCNFKIVDPGITNIKTFYPSSDQRDSFLNYLTPVTKINPVQDTSKIKESVTKALNMFKVW